MRHGWLRTMLLACAVSVAVAGQLPAAAAGSTGSGASGVASTASPAGVEANCGAGVRGGAPDRSGGMMIGVVRGTCTVTGDLGAPWELEVIARLQRKQSGAWRTQAIATVRLEDGDATRRVDWLTLGAPCASPATRDWRVRVVARAIIAEKSVFVLDSDVATSPVRTAAC